eukprot:gene19186-21108_t
MSNRRRGGRPVSNHDEDEEIYEELYSYAFSRDPTGEAAELPGQEDPPLQAQQDDDDGNDEATEFDWNPIAGNANRQGIDIGSEGLARTILEFILRNSRHVRLWSSGSVHITDGRLENNDSSDDDDEISLGYIYRPTSPQAEPCPDTSRIEGSTIQEELSPVSGAETTEKNITKLIMKRGNSSMNNFKCPRINFGRAERVQLNDRFLPNAMTTMKRFRQKVFCGQYSTDGNVFLSACQDQHIRLFDTTNGGFKLFRDIHAKDVGWSIVDTAYSPDQRFLIYSSWSDCIHLCNIYGDYETHVPLDLRPTDSRFCAFSVCFSEDNTHILAGGSDRCIYVYDRGGDTRSLKEKMDEEFRDLEKVYQQRNQDFKGACSPTGSEVPRCRYCCKCKCKNRTEFKGRKKQEIPQDVWNIIPSSGDYLRNVIEFSGYVTREAIIRLKDKDELEKMFAFVRSMHETVDDKNAMFGIFSKNPERVTLLPGLQISFERFLDAIEQLPETDESKAEVKYRKTQPKHETPLTDSQKIVCIDILKSRMEDWIYRQESAREKLDEMQIKPENTFAIAEISGSNNLLFQCLICQTRIAMQTSKGSLSLSNARRHLVKRCWLGSVPKNSLQQASPSSITAPNTFC